MTASRKGSNRVSRNAKEPVSVKQDDEATAKAQVSHRRPKSVLDVLRGQHRNEKDEGRENRFQHNGIWKKITTTYLRKLLSNLAANTSRITDLC